MALPTIGGGSPVTLHGCEAIRVSKSANILPLPMPTEDSDETEVFDMLGVTKLISIEGQYSAGTVAATKTWIDSLEALANGNQDLIDFDSDQTGIIAGMVASVETNWDLPGFKITYSIKFIQGTQ